MSSALQPRSGDGEGIGVLRAPDFAQHMLAFDHSTQNIALHVICDPCPCKGLQNTGIRVAGSRTRCKGSRGFRAEGKSGKSLCGFLGCFSGSAARLVELPCRKRGLARSRNVTYY